MFSTACAHARGVCLIQRYGALGGCTHPPDVCVRARVNVGAGVRRCSRGIYTILTTGLIPSLGQGWQE